MDDQKKFKVYLVAGLLLSTSVLIINHYVTMPDFLGGGLVGIGLGLMIKALIVQRRIKTLG